MAIVDDFKAINAAMERKPSKPDIEVQEVNKWLEAFSRISLDLPPKADKAANPWMRVFVPDGVQYIYTRIYSLEELLDLRDGPKAAP